MSYIADQQDRTNRTKVKFSSSKIIFVCENAYFVKIFYMRQITVESYFQRQIDRQTDRHTAKQKDIHTEWNTDRQTDRQKDRLTDRQTERQTNRNTDRQTDIQKESFKLAPSPAIIVCKNLNVLQAVLERLGLIWRPPEQGDIWKIMG